jgi:thymidylate kinase
MIYAIEGMDNCLKDAIIYELRASLPPETQVLKFSNPPKGVHARDYQMKHFQDMFDLMAATLAENKRHLILNRSHLGEFVYAPIYRQYEADWIFDMERNFLTKTNHSKQSILLLFYDSSNEKLKLREDGKSFSEMDDAKMDDERERFLQAFDKSYFKHKMKFDLSQYIRPNMDFKKQIDIAEIINQIITMTETR